MSATVPQPFERRYWVLAMLPLLLAAAPAPEAAAPAPAEGEATEQPAPPAVAPAGRKSLPKEGIYRVLGNDVKGPSGTVVAQVVNVLVDGQGTPVAAVLDYGGFLGVGKRRIAVEWRALGFGAEGMTLSLSRDQLKNFPELREGDEPVVATAPPSPS